MKTLFLLFFCIISNLLQSQIINRRGVATEEGGIAYPVMEPSVEAPAFDSSKAISIFTSKNGKKGVRKYKGDTLVEPIYDNIISSTGSLYIVAIGSKKGVITIDGKKDIIPVKYDDISYFYRGNTFFVTKKNKTATFDTEGKSILKLQPNKIEYSSKNGLSLIRNPETNALDIYIFNKKTKFSSNEIIVYQNDALVIKNDTKYGLFLDNDLFLNFEYDAIHTTTGSLNTNYEKQQIEKHNFFYSTKPLQYYYVEKNGKFGIYNHKEQIYPITLDKIKDDNSYRQAVIIEENNLKGIFFKNSNKIITPQYQNIHLDGTTYIELTKNGKNGLIDYNCNEILPFVYDDIYISSNKFIVTQNKKKGIVSTKGETLIPIAYDDFDTFLDDKNLVKVTNDNLYGIFNLSKNKLLFPVAYKYIFELGENNYEVITPDEKAGLYDANGNEILPAVYTTIRRSYTHNSKLFFALKDGTYTIINKDNKVLYPNEITEYFYLEDDQFFKIPDNNIVLKNTNGKTALFNEELGYATIPFMYDEILQFFDLFNQPNKSYYLVKNNKKFGIVDENNKTIIPLIYDFLSINFQGEDTKNVSFVAKKNKKFGIINIENQIITPFKYNYIEKISSSNLFKAKEKNTYCLLNEKGIVLNNGPFDEIANFEFIAEKEHYEAFAFYNGKMHILQDNGRLSSEAQIMDIHDGYKSFDELKQALIVALNDKDNQKMVAFSKKISPSKHLLQFLDRNVFTNEKLYLGENLSWITEKYTDVLLRFKYSYWNSDFYKKESLTNVPDFIIYENGIVTNKRATDWAYGDTKYLERILRNAIKINGFWISSYFMKNRF
ncbi:WG repeat-containing protein [Flavobacterium sp.]|uniref:WG repeat-containing protein n=1 Tax=Flavobacterium sp. TaxID=239 RepID=UPI003527527B